ncbi:MAG: tRNA lysidine(34) synthetase TilS, partial [Bacillota bacterium]
HLEYIISLSKKLNNAELDLPFGIRAFREYDKLVFLKKETDCFSPVKFDIGGKYVFFGEMISFEKDEKIVKGRSFDSQKIPENAVIRERKEGDIFKKCNGKTKKLSDFLTDIKLPKRKREKLLVVASGKEVYVVCGLEISDKVKIDENTKQIYTMKKETI